MAFAVAPIRFDILIFRHMLLMIFRLAFQPLLPALTFAYATFRGARIYAADYVILPIC